MKNTKDDSLIIWLLVIASVFWSYTQSSPQTAICRVLIVLLCLPFHELAHAYTAFRLGDPTAKEKGRVSFNPFAHLDGFGTLLLFTFGFGYAKPVPVNVWNFPPEKRKLYHMYTALAGPLSNILLSVFLMLISRILVHTVPSSYTVCSYLLTISYINISLAIFNLLPIPPLDGSSILGIILPNDLYLKTYKYQRYAIGAIFALSFILGRLGLYPLSSVTGKVYSFFYSIFFKS